MRRRFILPVIVVVVLILLYSALFYIKIPYIISGNGIVQPALEWRLDKTIDGKIVNSLKNHISNTVPIFSATEFQRGDLVQFSIAPNILVNSFIQQGDTIGYISSYEEVLKLLQLKRELDEKKRLREVYLTGEKPEAVEVAYQEMVSAEQEFDTQKKITERLKSLHDAQLIADQDYELATNDFNLKKQQVAITRATYQALISGAKKEDIALIDASIHHLNEQIAHTQSRLDNFFIITPITGRLMANSRETLELESLARITSTDSMILLMPIDISQLSYFQEGQRVSFVSPFNNQTVNGYVHSIDREIQQLNQRQTVFVTAIIKDTTNLLMPNLKVSADIDGGEITLAQYIIRLSKTVYNN